MAQRRMFSPDIVESDAFLEMPLSTQALYFHLGMFADDDGFVNPKKIVRMLGASEDDLKLLLVKVFLIPFDNGVMVIKHWRKNNLVRKDWYKPTTYVDQKEMLYVKENGSYTVDDTKGKKLLVNEPLTTRQRRLGKVSIDKVNNNIKKDSNIIIKKDNNSNTNSNDKSLQVTKSVDEVAEIIDLFKNVNPTHYRLFANKTQRACVERMAKKFGVEKLKNAIQFVEKSHGVQFAPTITTPYQLENKWGELQAFYRRVSQNQGNGKNYD